MLRGVPRPSSSRAGAQDEKEQERVRVGSLGVIKDNYTEEMRRARGGRREKEQEKSVPTYIGLVEFQ